MLKVFIGADSRQPLAYNVLQYSIVSRSSKPVSITPLILEQLPITRRGLTEFTYSRFLVPWLCDFKGTALFLDADMVVDGDIAELFDHASPAAGAVQVVKDQPQFEWPSAMLFNCALCRVLTPDYIENQANKLLDLAWAEQVGDLPAEWNRLLGYGPVEPGKLYHWTQGIPVWPETRHLPEDAIWHEAAEALTHTVPWIELMGKSVHAQPTLKRFLARQYGLTMGPA